MPHSRKPSRLENTSDEIQTIPEVPIEKFYDAQLSEVPGPARKLLETYSKIPPDEVYPHILQVRERAWSVAPYPCIGHFRFLDLRLAESPAYPEILRRLKEKQRFIDVGCCMGQEIRQLVADGVPAENLIGTDIHGKYFACGYDLFNDKETLNSLFLAADIFNKDSVLEQLHGKIDIVWLGSFLHLFNWSGQVEALKHIMKLLKPSPDGLIVGRLMGNTTAGEFAHPSAPQKTMYIHHEQSFKRMFHTAGDALGEKWETEVKVHPFEESLQITNTGGETTPKGALIITFEARKLARVDGATSHNFVF